MTKVAYLKINQREKRTRRTINESDGFNTYYEDRYSGSPPVRTFLVTFFGSAEVSGWFFGCLYR